MTTDYTFHALWGALSALYKVYHSTLYISTLVQKGQTPYIVISDTGQECPSGYLATSPSMNLTDEFKEEVSEILTQQINI